MKSLIRSFLTSGAGLFITSWIVPGLSLTQDILTFAMIAGSLTLANWFVKPILKIILLPLNLATFGLFSLAINAIILFGINYFLDGMRVESWQFDGMTYNGYVIPEISFGIIETYLVSGLIIGIVMTLVRWLVE